MKEGKRMKKLYMIPAAICSLLLVLFTVTACSDDTLGITVRFPEIAGLQQNDPVVFEGSNIGQVEKIVYTDTGNYLVEITIAREFVNAATAYTLFSIRPAGVDGKDRAVLLVQEKAGGEVLKEGSIVEGSVRSGYLEQIIGELQKKAGAAEGELRRALEELQKSLEEASWRLGSGLQQALADISLHLQSFKEDMKKVPDSQEVQRLEESIRRFADEFNRAQEDVRSHIREEVLPELQRELEQLREKLKRENRQDEMEEIDRQMDKVIMV